jgi:uncharacterized OB-fold protein
MNDLANNVALPLPDSASQAYWDAASEGRLLIQQCPHCETRQFYPRPFCIHCLSPDIEWIEAKGSGKIHTFSVVERTSDPRFIDHLPYVLAIVELDEGVKMTTRIVGAQIDALQCDMPVQVVFEELNADVALPVFTLAEGK